MADAIKFKISPAVAAFVRPGVSSDQKLAGLAASASLEPFDRITLVYCLMKDADAIVKGAAKTAFVELPDNVIITYVDASEAHPAVLDLLAKVHHARPWVVQALLGNKILSAPARAFLVGRTDSNPAVTVESSSPDGGEGDDVKGSTGGQGDGSPDDAVDVDDAAADDAAADDADADADDAADEPDEEPGEIDEDDEQFLSKYKIAMVMGISEKIKMALSGDKEWRSILIKDANKLVSGSVIKNPRITDGEILTILKVGVQNDEIIRLICANKEWVKNYMIRKALIDCPKTPLPNALRFLASMNEKDVASYAKSKNISSVISTQAKRMLLAKKR